MKKNTKVMFKFLTVAMLCGGASNFFAMNEGKDEQDKVKAYVKEFGSRAYEAMKDYIRENPQLWGEEEPEPRPVVPKKNKIQSIIESIFCGSNAADQVEN